MDIKFSKGNEDKFLSKLQEEYDVYAPMSYGRDGRYSGMESIRYGKISSFSEVVHDRKSHYSAKEVLFPINYLYAVKLNDEIIKTKPDVSKKKLIILRACDINAIERIDNKFLKDDYYSEVRKNVKFMVMECVNAFDTCFCLSTGTNKTENYSLAVRFNEDSIFIKVKDSDFDKYIDSDYEKTNFDVKFVEKNKIKVNKPEIETWDNKTFTKVRNMEFWNDYKKRCIGCGSCNASCPTCTCVITKEVKSDTSNVIEVRKIWGGCQLVKSKSLVDRNLVDIIPARVRQRVLDKFYMPKLETSEEQLCVGCGRCIDICPRSISFANTVNRLTEELNK